MKCNVTALLTLVIFSISASEQMEAIVQQAAAADMTCCCYESDGWRIQQTENFRICTRSQTLDLTNLPALCESLRAEIREACLLDDAAIAWTPRCDVIVHSSLAEYQRALGASVGGSVGCATMKVDGSRVISRRIDIRADADAWQEDALPHELTHVVLLDRFGGRRLPPWADEGLGVLAESRDKQLKRAQAFAGSAKSGGLYQPGELLTLRQFPAPGLRDAFYTQSAALVEHLCGLGTRDQFFRFVERSLDSGEHAALAEVYGISTPADLHRITQTSHVFRLLSQTDFSSTDLFRTTTIKLAAATND